MLRRFRLALAALLAGLVLAAAPAAAAAPPELAIEAPPALESYAVRLRRIPPEQWQGAMELLGLAEGGGAIRVFLAPEGSPLAEQAPAWSSGYAAGNAGVVVLMPQRLPAYPDRSLEVLLAHEVAHVLIARAARGGSLPRWFDEGLATLAARGWGLEDRTRLALSLALQDPVPLAELDAGFAGSPATVRRTYALSASLVRELVQRRGPGAPARILSLVARGEAFDGAFRQAVGEEPERFAAAFFRRQTFWNRWLPLLTSSTVLWIAITVLALVAFHRRRQRDAELRRLWDEEEAWRTGEAGGDWVH